MSVTGPNPGAGVLGFAIAFIAYAFGGTLGLPESVSLLVIDVGVLLAVLSAGMRGLGLAALVLGGIVLVSSMSLLGALGAGRDQDEVPPHASSTGTTRTPQENGGYILTQHDKEYVDYTWDRSTPAQRRVVCAQIVDGVSDAEMEKWIGRVEEQGFPVTEEYEANFRARFEYMAATYC